MLLPVRSGKDLQHALLMHCFARQLCVTQPSGTIPITFVHLSQTNLAFWHLVNAINECALCFLTAKDCGNLTVPQNGSLNGRETTFPNEATFSCDEGFILNGSTVRRCQSDGTWSGIRTSCHGEIITCSYQNISKTIKRLQVDQQSCKRCKSLCSHPRANAPQLGRKMPSGNARFTSFSCFLFHTVLFALSISLYFLLAVDCGPLSDPINGSSYGDFTVFPNSVLFKCDAGFNLGGSSARMCQANGTWSGLAAACVGRLQAKGQRRALSNHTMYVSRPVKFLFIPRFTQATIFTERTYFLSIYFQ